MGEEENPSILIVDDRPENLLALEKVLRPLSLNIVKATSGNEALAQSLKHDFALVLLDVQMPEMDGFETAELMRGIDDTKHVPIIFATAISKEQEYVFKGYESGAVDYLFKPIEPGILKSKVNIFVDLFRQKKVLARTTNTLKLTVEKLNTANQEILKHKELIQRDYELASDIFANIVRSEDFMRTDMKYFLWPMDLTSGDLVLVSPKPPDGLYVFVGDFTGHGLSAAIGAVPVSDIFYSMTKKGCSVSDIVAVINRKLKNILPTCMFCCACVMELDQSCGGLTVWNGGLPDVLVLERQGGIKYRLSSRDFALGVVGDHEIIPNIENIELAHGDRVYAYTDGVTELSGPDSDIFGQQRLEECLIQGFAQDHTLDEIKNALKAFRKDAPKTDDVTMIELTSKKDNGLWDERRP